MPRLNLYEQQTTAQGPRASGADFGAAPAQALEGMGNVLQDIGERVQRREELGAAQDVMEGVDTWAVTALDDFQKRQDIMSQQALPEFQNALNQKRQEALGNFSGRPEARAALERQLDNQLAQYGKSAITAKIKAGQDQMGRALDQQFNKSMMQVDAAPDIWSFAKDENLAAVEMWKPAMSKDQYESAKRLAYAKPLQAAVRSQLAQGNIEGAEKLMTDESFSKYLTMEEARPLRIDAAVSRGKMDQEERKVEGDRKALSYLLGYEATREQALTLPGISNMPMVQKLNVIKMMNGGKDLPDEAVNRILGLEKQRSDSMIDELTTEALNYKNMTPEQQFAHRMKAQKVFGIQRRINDKGYLETFSNVPDELQALYSGAPVGVPASGGPVVMGSVTGDPAGDEAAYARSLLEGREGTVAIPPDSPFYDPTQPAGATSVRPGTRAEANLTVDEMLYDVSGVGGAVGGVLGRTPGIGPSIQEEVPGVERAQRYKARVTSGQNQIVALLQKNDKYPEGERKMIADEVAKVIRVWDNPESATRNLRGIDLSLNDRQIAAEKTRDDTTLDKDTREQARQIATQIKSYRKQLGVLQPKDEKEIKQLVDEGELYPGRNFWTPEGRRVRFTQEAYDAIVGNKKK